MIEKIPVGNLISPNPRKGNEAFNPDRLARIVQGLEFAVKESAILTFEPGGWGGDHEHERGEVMIAVHGDPTIVYPGDSGQRIEESMGPDEDGTLFAYRVHPWTPHLVENRTDQPVTIYELRDMISANYRDNSGTAASLRDPVS